MTTEQKVTSEAVAEQIASTLSESNIGLVRRVVHVIGAERAQVFLQTTLEIEARGGLPVRDESRRRTPGGVFFHTVRNNVSVRERKQIWPWTGEKKRSPQPKLQANGSAAPPSPSPSPLTWEQAHQVALKLHSATKGKAILKLTIIGRPKQVAKVQSGILCLIEDHSVPVSLPKGLPIPPEGVRQTVAVFITEKQWRKVEASLKSNMEDELIIEGWPYFDQIKQITILLPQGVTTKLIQRSQREKQP